ncbi:MAG: Uma2 family endonuclease [Kutzneria sp.]|nr:Uma2 family endonuclease [Kutzneria sp.]
MAAPTFDPLVDLDGLWTTELAERYLPIPGMPAAKYECLDGRLYVSPYESSANSYAAGSLLAVMRQAARGTGARVYGTVNLPVHPGRWIQPDVTVLTEPAGGGVWVPASLVMMPVKLVSPSSRKRDRIDKPALRAELGIPHYMEAEIPPQRSTATVRLLKLDGSSYAEHASVIAGHLFETDLPFLMSFDPVELLDL